MQHLLGIGHLVRGARIAAACAARDFDVMVVLGGERPAGIDFGAAAVQTLPAIKAGPGGFSDLVGPDGRPLDDALRAQRRGVLLDLFGAMRPDILLIEAFPFGRRAMGFELLPLLAAACDRATPPLVACSVRDILQEHRQPGRDAETIATVQRWFDLVLVHGDPQLAPLEATFPRAAALAGRIAYSGLVGPPRHASAATDEEFDVIVSVGGGAVGAQLIETALAARPLSRLATASWLVLAGPNAPAMLGPAPGVTVRGFVADLPQRLRRARLSISQAGYNTAADLLAAPACRAVLVPYVGDGETEQTRRAALMEARGLAVAVAAAALPPERLAAAIDRALALPPRPMAIDLDGAARSAAILQDALARRAGGPFSRLAEEGPAPDLIGGGTAKP